mmetsp:Transcript_45698/g.111342  ORF Transcript_45698/g.111342 Transcript_45698/m.111342 type:complete len:194 (-) Transcript_45698:68-649(-)
MSNRSSSLRGDIVNVGSLESSVGGDGDDGDCSGDICSSDPASDSSTTDEDERDDEDAILIGDLLREARSDDGECKNIDVCGCERCVCCLGTTKASVVNRRRPRVPASIEVAVYFVVEVFSSESRITASSPRKKATEHPVDRCSLLLSLLISLMRSILDVDIVLAGNAFVDGAGGDLICMSWSNLWTTSVSCSS